MDDDYAFAEARKHAKIKLDFYVHLAVYLVAISSLLMVNLLTGPGYLWFLWPTLGWGFALLLHGLSAFILQQKKEGIVDSIARREMKKRHSKHP